MIMSESIKFSRARGFSLNDMTVNVVFVVTTAGRKIIIIFKLNKINTSRSL